MRTREQVVGTPVVVAKRREVQAAYARLGELKKRQHGQSGTPGASYDTISATGIEIQDAEAEHARLSADYERAVTEATTVQPRRIDLFETNSGGLILCERATKRGLVGFEMGQNVARLRAPGRDEFTFAADAAGWDDLLAFVDASPDDARRDGSLYRPLTSQDVESLYERETDQPIRVATWEGGVVTVHRERSIAAAACWYLAGDAS